MKKIWRFLKKAFLFCFISSLVYLLICRFLLPPITITQLGDSFSYGLERDYVSWNQISRNV